MNTKKEIGNRLLQIRTYLDLKQHEMADRIGISRTSYVEYENGTGKGNVSKKSVEKIKQALNINPDWLLLGEGEMKLLKEYVQKDIEPNFDEDKKEYSTTNEISELIKMNRDLVTQVSDLIKMQLLNAETINNLSKRHVKSRKAEEMMALNSDMLRKDRD